MVITKKRFNVLNRSVCFDRSAVMPKPLLEKSFPSIFSLALDVSGRCNMRCTYCAESATMPERNCMEMTMVNAAVDALFAWSKVGSGVSLHFGSGEPMLHPDAVFGAGDQAKKLAELKKRSLSLYLTTNGTLLEGEEMKRLAEEGWNVKVSLDGGGAVHDKYRVDQEGKGTFSRIEGKVRYLLQKMPARLSTTSVLCRGTDPMKVFYDIASMGVKKIELVPVAAPKGSQLSLCREDLHAYGRFICEYAKRIANGQEVPINIRFQKRLQRALGFGNSTIACGAGRTFFAVDHSGTIYPCFRFVGIKGKEMGTLAGIDQSKVRSFARGPGRQISKRSECNACWAAPLCSGPCFACAELLGSGAPAREFCEFIKIESKAALWLIESMKEGDAERLIAIIEGQVDTGAADGPKEDHNTPVGG